MSLRNATTTIITSTFLCTLHLYKVRLYSYISLLVLVSFIMFTSVNTSKISHIYVCSSHTAVCNFSYICHFLSALIQMHHSATVGACRFTDVDRNLNVFHFCNKLIFTGVSYQTPAQPPNLEDQGGHTSSGLLPFDLFGMGDPNRSTRLQPT